MTTAVAAVAAAVVVVAVAVMREALADATASDDRDLPLADARTLLGGLPLLVLAPHPDDESLGCGALLAEAFLGRGARVVCLTDGAASHPGSRAVPPARLAAIRLAEMVKAVRALGGGPADVAFLDAPDAGLDAGPAIVGRVAALAQGCGLLLAPSPLDPHRDHEAAAAIGALVAAQVPGLRLGYYPIWSRWRDGGAAVPAPVPDGTRACRLPPGRHAAAKARAIAAHRSQAGLVVPDAPDGFSMPDGFAAFFARRDEVFFLAEPP